MQPSKCFLVLPMVVCLGLASCGGGGSATTTPPPTPGSVNGNWNIVGSPGPSGATQLPMLNLAVAVSGTSIYGYGDVWVEQKCANGTSGIDNPYLILSGTVNSDGSFVLTNPIPYDIDVQVKGQIPQTASTGWSGSYSVANWSQYTCTFSSSNTFTATEIPLLTGPFTGTTVGTHITVSTQLTQGTAVVDPPTVPLAVGSLPVYLPLSGTITVGGVSCFTTGTVSSVAGTSYTSGDEFVLSYTMEDGSTLNMNGYLADSTGNNYYFGLSSSGSKCSATVDGGGTLTR